MPGNGCSGQVDEGLDPFGMRIEESGWRIPRDLWQLSRSYRSGSPEFGSRAHQSIQIVTLMIQGINHRGSHETRGPRNQYFH